MNGLNPFWISRKEISSITGLSYWMVRQNEERWGLGLLRVQVNSRTTIFPRQETLAQIRQHFPCLKL